MVFQDICQIREIDNELILFKELFKFNNCKYCNSLLISPGGRITQHLVEFLAGRQGCFKYVLRTKKVLKIMVDSFDK